VSCEREFSSLQGKVSVTLQPSSAVFLLCKREKVPFAKESRSHDTGQYNSCTKKGPKPISSVGYFCEKTEEYRNFEAHLRIIPWDTLHSSVPRHGAANLPLTGWAIKHMRRWYSFGTPDYLWLASLLSAKIVSCSNINEYVRNYQDCLTLVAAIGISQNMAATHNCNCTPSITKFSVFFFVKCKV
jgi:hypothetical protein